ncbi:TetR/AcrR family transcriptional regulator [uncultured Phascolarctobacterium sp.]|uniref:TetR/AcrR family transcriptional regulator n=1 Tax=uncultured Phascolarctobacterium sp. TaxID=512296 RepID=UPI0026332B08|nr:TetR/AcrR family transcriptional regulator [uncultured Phascolarctobacterium sp.]
MHKGLNKEKIVLGAIELLHKNAFQNFSVRTLAEHLDVKPASLYKHFKSFDELTIAVGLEVYEAFNRLQQQQVSKATTRQKALLNLSMAYSIFFQEHPNAYNLLLMLPKMENSELHKISEKFIEPVKNIIELYKIDEESKLHWQRIYLATVVGFIVGVGSGVSACIAVNSEESYRMAIMNIIAALESMEREQMGRADYLKMNI